MTDPMIDPTHPAALLATLPKVHPGLRNVTVLVGWTDDAPDLAETVRVPRAAYPDEEHAAARRLVADGATYAVVVAYTDADDASRAAGQAEFLTVCLSRYGVTVEDALRVTDGRWWSYGCTDTSCCPPEGNPIPQGATP